jgi:hypothetical protein
MLVGGSPEQACLAGVFIAEQQPHRTSLVSIEQVASGAGPPCPASARHCSSKDTATPRCGANPSAECCCKTTVPVIGNPACWSGLFTAARCCDTVHGANGDTSCWSGVYDYNFCCVAQTSGGRRSLQSAGPHSEGEVVSLVRITLAAEAPTPQARRLRPFAPPPADSSLLPMCPAHGGHLHSACRMHRRRTRRSTLLHNGWSRHSRRKDASISARAQGEYC